MDVPAAVLGQRPLECPPLAVGEERAQGGAQRAGAAFGQLDRPVVRVLGGLCEPGTQPGGLVGGQQGEGAVRRRPGSGGAQGGQHEVGERFAVAAAVLDDAVTQFGGLQRLGGADEGGEGFCEGGEVLASRGGERAGGGADQLDETVPGRVQEADGGGRPVVAACLQGGAQGGQGGEPLRSGQAEGGGPRRLGAVPRAQHRPGPARAVARGQFGQGRHVARAQVLDPERGQEHRRGARVVHGEGGGQGGGEQVRGPFQAADGAGPERREGGGAAGGVRPGGAGEGGQLLRRPARRCLGPVGEAVVAWPDDDGGAPVPAVQGVAVVAHVPLVVRGVGRQGG